MTDPRDPTSPDGEPGPATPRQPKDPYNAPTFNPPFNLPNPVFPNEDAGDDDTDSAPAEPDPEAPDEGHAEPAP